MTTMLVCRFLRERYEPIRVRQENEPSAAFGPATASAADVFKGQPTAHQCGHLRVQVPTTAVRAMAGTRAAANAALLVERDAAKSSATAATATATSTGNPKL